MIRSYLLLIGIFSLGGCGKQIALPAPDADSLRGHMATSGLGGWRYDMNGDGKVTTADVTALISYIRSRPASVNLAYDVNGDNKVNARDIPPLVSEIRRRYWDARTNPVNKYDANDDGDVTIADVRIITSYMRSGYRATAIYFDVNADGYVDEADAQAVVTYLRRITHGT